MTTSRHPVIAFLYDILLGGLAGLAFGFFAWLSADRLTDGNPPFWPWAMGGIVALIVFVRWARAHRATRHWVHLLWIPVAVFIALIAMVILALRAFN